MTKEIEVILDSVFTIEKKPSVDEQTELAPGELMFAGATPTAVDEWKDKKLSPRKKITLEAMRHHKGIVSHACKAAGIARFTYYGWLKEDPIFKEAAESVCNFVLDEVESAAHKLINEGNPTMIIFYLKCRGKERGYIEKQQIEYSTGDLSTLRDAMNDLAVENEY